jgi:RHS repeat-associated protein
VKDANNKTTNYAYDDADRLTSVTDATTNATSYTYDNLSRLLSVLHKLNGRTIDGATYAVDNVGNRTSKTNQLNAVTEDYSYDAIYQLTQVVQNGATTTDTYTYDSFGNLAASSGSTVNPFRYTAREWDSETGLYVYRARHYDSARGRFVSEDPIGIDGADINFYRFVRNSPVRFSDPFGLLAIDPTFNPDCLPALRRALDIVRRIAKQSPACNCAFRSIGCGRSLADLVEDPNITIKYSPGDIYTRDQNGRIISVVAAYVFPYNTTTIFIKPYSCRVGRWQLAAALVHELVHLTKGSVPADDEVLPRDMEYLCGTTAPPRLWRR